MKVNMMVQRLVILLLVLMVVFVGCGEDEPEKVKPKRVEEVEEFKVHPHLGWCLFLKGNYKR